MAKGQGWGRRFGTASAGALWGGLLIALGAVAPAATARAQAASLTFAGTTNVGTPSAAVTVTLTAQATGSGAAPVALTSGVANLDFSIVPNAGTCGDEPTLLSGQTCTVNVVFTPRYPGVRQGAVVIESADGTEVLASAALSGVGTGGLPVLVPGEINTVAGNGELVSEDSETGLAVDSAIFLPRGLVVDGGGNLFFCDSNNNRVRRVDAVTGDISTVAGDGTVGSSGDGGAAVNAELSTPAGLVLDGAGNLYIADSGNNVVRRVDAVSGIITTVAGKIGGSGFTGDGGAATNATLTSPQGLALTPGGDLVIADSGDQVVRLVTFSNGRIQTIAGTGTAGYSGDGHAATSAQLNQPWGVAVRADGTIAIADFGNQVVRLVSASGTISTVAGTGQQGYSPGGDSEGEVATQEMLNNPAAVAFDPAGDLVIADSGNNRVVGVYGSPGVMTTLTGSTEGFGGDGGPANKATLYAPYGLFFDAQGNIWISDMSNNRVREISGSMLNLDFPTMKVGKVSSPPMVEMLYNAGNNNLTLSAPVLNQAALDPGTTTCGQSAMAPMVFCNMGVEFAPTQTGQNVAGSIHWTSDAPNVTPVDDLNGEVLSVNPTTTTLNSSANPGVLGQPVTLTAVVSNSPANTPLSGTVTFSEGSDAWCSAVPLAPNNTATCQIPSLSLGTHTFTASYSGDDDDAASTSASLAEVVKQQPALALAVNSPAVVTSNVTLTLQATDQTGTPTGSVVFLDGTTTLATVPLNSSGIATWTTNTLAVGTHNFTAQYSGDSANVAGTAEAQGTITPASTMTLLASSSSSATVGTAVTLTATVASNDGPAPTGPVEFTDGSGAGATVLGYAPLNSSGVASITVSTLSPGNHSLVATYSGDTDDAASSSSPLAETIQQIATGTTLGSDANPVNAGATLHLTATVSMSPGATADGSLSGTVTFSDGSTVLGTAPLNSAGQAVLSVSTLSVGQHTITASFGGSTNYATSSSVGLNETVQQTATQVALSSTATTTLVGKPATFTATVTSATGVPTGTITFHDGSTVLGTATLNANGSASFTTTALTQGTHSISAAYSGDANYVASTSAVLQQTVQLAQPTLTLSGPSSAVDAGTTIQVTAALSTPGVAPTGTLTLLDGGTAIGTAAVTGAGNFTFSTNKLAIGTHTLTVAYSGDANNAAVTSAAITVVVQQAGSTTSLAASANPVTQGSPLTLTATVASASPNAGGTVNFFEGSTLLGSVALGANGTASFNVANLTAGTYSLTAVYGGDTDHASSTSAPVSELVVQSSSASLSSSVNPAASGQSVTFTAQVGGGGSVAPTGTVTFEDNGALLATVPLNGAGVASFSTATLSVGTHTITASYGGDHNFAAVSAQLIQTVVNASTQVTLAASANPATYAQPLALTATVNSNGGAATGTVSFTDGGTSIGSAQLNASGTAVLTISTLLPGAHNIVANYLGDGKASASVSTPLALTVKQTTTLAVSANSNPASTLSPVAFTATLTNAGAGAATGTVSFSDGATVIGTAPIDGSGHATLTLPQMTAGAHSIVANYAGDGENFASTSAVYSETVQLRPTTTTVTGSPTDPTNLQQITLIAVVSGQGSVPPSGSVSFTSGNVTLGTATVDATGVATVTVIFEQSTEPVVASYSGDASYANSQSGSTTIVAGEAPQFTLSVNVPSVTIATKQHTTINVSIGSVKGFSDTIALGCLGLPYAATCTFNSSQLKLAANGTATASLIIDTGDPLGAGSGASASVRREDGSTLLCALPLGLLALLFGRKRRARARRRIGMLLVMVAALALSIGAVGCGGLSTGSTPPGTYTFKVVGTGQGSGTTQAQTVTLVVTQ